MNKLAQWETDFQMKFNVAKCQSMRVTRHPPDKQIHFDYSIHQQKLEHVQSANYLGINISDDLDWSQHISEISCKATKTLGFLQCNLALAPRNTKEGAYNTLIRPRLEYAPPIWHPYHETKTRQVGKMQRTAASWTIYICHTESTTHMGILRTSANKEIQNAETNIQKAKRAAYSLWDRDCVEKTDKIQKQHFRFCKLITALR